MVGTRFFSGGRDPGKRSVASELMRIEIQKKGKLPTNERYKMLFQKKMKEAREQAAAGNQRGFKLPGSNQEVRKMSKRAENALKEIAAKKAAKETKRLRQMVIVQPKNYYNGNINKKGKIYDIAGNQVAQVNIKNGKMATMLGWGFGKYKPKSIQTHLAIQEAINKFSPYYINLRKMQMMQQGGWNPSTGGIEPMNDTVSLNGHNRDNPSAPNMYGYTNDGSTLFSSYGQAAEGPRQEIGVTGWGAMSSNVWGTFADNAHGNSMDNVWGTNSSDVWGGIGGNPWGNHAKTVRVWGTGSGHNYLKGLAARVATFFGLNVKSSRSGAVHEALVRNARSTRSSGSTTRSAPVTTRAPSAPTTTRR